MTVGGHTVSHPILANLDAEAQRAEIMGCRARLHAELGIPMRWFSYPNGDRGSFDARTRALLAEAGVERAFSFDGGFVRRGAPWDALRRAADRGRPADRRPGVRRDRDAPAGVHPPAGREPGMTARRVRAALGAIAAAAALGGCVGQEATFEPVTGTTAQAPKGPVRLYVDKDSVGGPCDDQRPATAAASAATPWCSLDRAADAAPSGATVLVRRGPIRACRSRASAARAS